MSAQTVRTAAACLWWAEPCRRDADAIRGCVAGLSDAERAQVAELIASDHFAGWDDEQLLAVMTGLGAVKSLTPGVV